MRFKGLTSFNEIYLSFFTCTVTIRFIELKWNKLLVSSLVIVTQSMFGYCGGLKAVCLFVNVSAISLKRSLSLRLVSPITLYVLRWVKLEITCSLLYVTTYSRPKWRQFARFKNFKKRLHFLQINFFFSQKLIGRYTESYRKIKILTIWALRGGLLEYLRASAWETGVEKLADFA